MRISRKRRFVKSKRKAAADEADRQRRRGWTKYIPTMGVIHRAINDIFVATVVPECFVVLWLTGLIALSTLKLCLIGCLVLFVVLPLIFKYSVTLQRSILFLTFITYPKNLNFAAPEELGLFATRNFVIAHDESDADDNDESSSSTISTSSRSEEFRLSSGSDDASPLAGKPGARIRLGVWHVLPHYVAKRYAGPLNLTANDTRIVTETETLAHHLDDERAPLDAEFRQRIDDANRERFYQQQLREPSAEIVLYLHGNSNSRGAAHRVEIYQLLRRLGYHVLTLDYRGYGDSTGAPPTERGVVRDALALYEYVRQHTQNPVYVWGHSLGSGIATHMMSVLAQGNVVAPRAVVLESPFNNIAEEIRSHPMSRLFRNLPWFDYMIARPLYSNHLRFESDEHIAEFRQPVMILHAEDDMVIPFELGYKLYRSALDSRGKMWGPVEFHRFGAEHGFGHKYICRSIELPPMVTAFFNAYRNTNY